MQARARFSPSSGPLIWTLFGYLFEPMLDPCSLVVRRQAASAAPFGVSMGPRIDLLCLLICLLPPLASLLAHGLLFGSLFAYPSKPFAALELHFWRPRRTYLVVFKVNLIHQFCPCTTFKEGTGQ